MSRWDAFLQEEKDYLLMLPAEPYELLERKEAKVQPNSHIAYQGHFYSLSFEHVGETVDVRTAHSTVEIFYHLGELPRTNGCGQNRYATVQDHMPQVSDFRTFKSNKGVESRDLTLFPVFICPISFARHHHRSQLLPWSQSKIKPL